MRTPYGWVLPPPKSLQVLCACCALWSVPAVSVGASNQVMPPQGVSTPTPAAAISTARNSTIQIGGVAFDRRVLSLVAMVCVIGTIAGWARRGPRELRVRLLAKPKRTRPRVLVPAGPAPRLIPGESPKAIRSRRDRAPALRMAPVDTGSGIIDYIAPFVGSGEASENARLDYLLESGDSAESLDPPAGRD